MANIKTELVTLLRGAIAAAIVAAFTALVNYGGAHISTIITDLGMIVGGYAGVKTGVHK